MRKVRYFASYHGPSYYSYGTEYMDGFSSISSAMQSMRNRQMGMDYLNRYRENEDGAMVPWSMDYRSDFSATTEFDFMDLYLAYPQEDGTYSCGIEIAYRLTIGERGGVVVNPN